MFGEQNSWILEAQTSQMSDTQTGFASEIYWHDKVLPAIYHQTKKGSHSKLLQKIIEKNPTYSADFSSLSDEKRQWILEYLSGGKGVIRYEKIKSHEDLNRVPEGEFFSRSEF